MNTKNRSATGVGNKKDIEKEQAVKMEELVEQMNKKKDLESIEKSVYLYPIEYRDMSMKFGHVFKAGTVLNLFAKSLKTWIWMRNKTK